MRRRRLVELQRGSGVGYVAGMSDVERMVARMVCVGFEGTRVSGELEEMLRRGVGAVALFGRNVESAGQVAELCYEIKRRADGPVIVCVDQEGGRVRRLREGFACVPSMRELGATGDESLAYEVGRVLGRELRAVNIDLDFAPVLDVDTNPGNPVIADRSFGATPELVEKMGCAVMRGLQDEGVAACGKHFPGHGDTSQDSHHDLPRLKHGMERLENVELRPFEAAVNGGVACIMTSHVIFEPLDAECPATMSAAVLDGILRKRMGFEGVVISDDLEMKAVADHYALEEVVVRGVNAGVDLLAICRGYETQRKAMEILTKAVAKGAVDVKRVEEANRRIAQLAERFVKRGEARPDLGALNCEQHRRIMERIGAGARRRLDDPTEAKPESTEL